MFKNATLNPDEVLKLKAVALYVINKMGIVDFHKLFKIIYFADQEHYVKYGRRIMNDTFCSFVAGPVLTNLYDAIKISEGSKEKSSDPSLVTISNALTVCSKGSKNYFIKGCETADLDELSKSDILCLEKSITENANLDYNVLIEKSHDSAYDDGLTNTHRFIRPIMMARAIGANNDTIDYLQQKESLKALFA